MQSWRGHKLLSLTAWEKGMVSVGRRELRDPTLRCLLDMQPEMLHGIEYISLEFRGECWLELEIWASAEYPSGEHVSAFRGWLKSQQNRLRWKLSDVEGKAGDGCFRGQGEKMFQEEGVIGVLKWCQSSRRKAVYRLWIKQCNFIDDSYKSFFSGVLRGKSINGVGPRESGSMWKKPRGE